MCRAKTIGVEVVWGMFGCSGDTYVWHAGSSNSHSRAGHGAGAQYSEERERSKIASLEISKFKSRECQESEAHKSWGFIVHECRDFEAPFKLKWYNPHVIGLPTNASKWNDYRLKRSTRIQGKDHYVKEAVDDLSYDGNLDLPFRCCCKHWATRLQRKKALRK